MAEGGGISSIKDGSDIDFEFSCTPCGEDNIREEAVKYCPECQEYLCVRCARCHGRMKASRAHILVERDDARHSFMVTTVNRCRYHPDRDIEMYCVAHDMVYCAKCIATKHRSCERVDSIEDCPTTNFQEDEIQNLQKERETVQEHLKAVSEMKKENINALEKQKTEVLQQFKDIEKNLIEHIRKLGKEGVEAFTKDHSEIKDDLLSDISVIEEAMSEVQALTNQFQTFTRMDARQQFVQMKLIQRTVADARKLGEDSEEKGTKSVCFSETADLKTSVITAISLGKVHKVTENRAKGLYKLKSKRNVKVKVRNDRKICFISDICQLQDGTIILTDQDNNKIKRLDKNYNVKDHLDLDASPRGICCTDTNTVAVKMNNNKVQFVTVSSSLSKMRQISIVGGSLWGMACCNGELWISTRRGIRVYSTRGTLLKSIAKDENGQKIFKPSPQHMAVSEETVIVTDNTDGAVCIAKDGTVRRQLRDPRLQTTRGACVSNDGTMFLSGYSSNNLVAFNSNGKWLGEIAVEEEHPGALLHDKDKNCIIMACAKSNNYIHVLEIDI